MHKVPFVSQCSVSWYFEGSVTEMRYILYLAQQTTICCYNANHISPLQTDSLSLFASLLGIALQHLAHPLQVCFCWSDLYYTIYSYHQHLAVDIVQLQHSEEQEAVSGVCLA